MHNAWELEKVLPKQFGEIINSDKQGIDNPDLYHHARLNYIDLTQTRLDIITSAYPHPKDVPVLDVGCAQGNLALLLAEQGFPVTAVEINQTFLEYAGYKYETGTVNWVLGNFDTLKIDQSFDVVILGEIIEHCAYPEDMVQKALQHLKPNGLLVISTPNASMFANKQPTFKQMGNREQRRLLENRQFGPEGEDHLFLFTLAEINLILPPNTRVKKNGYLGGTILINRRTGKFFRWLPVQWVERIVRMAAHFPMLNKLTCHGIFVVVTKEI